MRLPLRMTHRRRISCSICHAHELFRSSSLLAQRHRIHIPLVLEPRRRCLRRTRSSASFIHVNVVPKNRARLRFASVSYTTTTFAPIQLNQIVLQLHHFAIKFWYQLRHEIVTANETGLSHRGSRNIFDRPSHGTSSRFPSEVYSCIGRKSFEAVASSHVSYFPKPVAFFLERFRPFIDPRPATHRDRDDCEACRVFVRLALALRLNDFVASL